MKCGKEQLIWALLRLSLGWIFFWAFVDKLFGLGFDTAANKSWLAGVSPTFGFLKFATKGPFTSVYQGIAGSALVDWLFMLGLLFVGATLILGIMVRLGSYTGILMLILMYTAGFIFPEHNPFLDEHIIYSIVLIGIAASNSGQCLGLGERWSATKLAQKNKIFQ